MGLHMTRLRRSASVTSISRPHHAVAFADFNAEFHSMLHYIEIISSSTPKKFRTTSVGAPGAANASGDGKTTQAAKRNPKRTAFQGPDGRHRNMFTP
jgi:hypothetical protein